MSNSRDAEHHYLYKPFSAVAMEIAEDDWLVVEGVEGSKALLHLRK